MCCFVILLLFNEMQMSERRFSAIPHLNKNTSSRHTLFYLFNKLDSALGGLKLFNFLVLYTATISYCKNNASVDFERGIQRNASANGLKDQSLCTHIIGQKILLCSINQNR